MIFFFILKIQFFVIVHASLTKNIGRLKFNVVSFNILIKPDEASKISYVYTYVCIATNINKESFTRCRQIQQPKLKKSFRNS